MTKQWRVAVIGATGRGNYGHFLDTCFLGLEGFGIVAVADANEPGLEAAGKRLGVSARYRDYRAMLANEKPDIVSIGPRHVDQRLEMAMAAAEAGCHIFCEKPLAGDLKTADAMLAACQRSKLKIAVAHQTRAMPPVQQVLKELRSGSFGPLVRMAARGKEDGRGGGEDLIVLGTHMMDLMTLFAGPPQWVSAQVMVDDRLATRADKRNASEPVGSIAGNHISATYGFANGVVGLFESKAKNGAAGRSPFGVTLECGKARISIRSGEAHVYPHGIALPTDDKIAWKKVFVEDWHFYPDHKPRPMNDTLLRGNQIIVRDLTRAIDEDRAPISSGDDARNALEMIQGVYASHLAGGARVTIPQPKREHPLDDGTA